MDLFEAIAKRHSYRGPFADKPIPQEDLRRIVQAGIQAPSGLNAQTTEFVIVDDPQIVQKIRLLHRSNMAMQQAVVYIACIVDFPPQEIDEDLSFQVEDCAAAVENMLLAITALGYATVWIDGWLRRKDRATIIGDYLHIPNKKRIRVLLPIGIPTEIHPQKEKKLFQERAWFNIYASK